MNIILDDNKNSSSHHCCKLHALFHEMKQHKFPFSGDIPKNGIYVLFESGEHGHGGDRIVRVGTHTGNDQLKSRLNQHFTAENKDRSIFRKNIGRALLNKESDPFLEQWEWDLTSRESKNRYSHLLDKCKKESTEKKVTNYIQNNLSFIVISVDDKEERLTLESRIISTVSLCSLCRPSDAWLGLQSPKFKIRESGLWLVNELYKKTIDNIEFERVSQLCSMANKPSQPL